MALANQSNLLNREVAHRLCSLAERAGDAIMDVYESADFETEYKEDDSPLTRADVASNEILVEGLRDFVPDMPILSEESKQADYAERSKWDYFWMVDLLDGIKEFIKQNGEFTVNIALIREGRPVLGIVHAPAAETTYWAAEGIGSFQRKDGGDTPIEVSGDVDLPVTVVVSRSHLRARDREFIEALEEEYGEVETAPTGSSLKLCRVASGHADVYPRFGPTMEWDIAAAHCVLEQAGGVVWTVDGEQLKYNKEELVNPFFIARSPALELPSELD